MLPPDVAAAVERARQRLHSTTLTVEWHSSLGSTMDAAAEAAEDGAAEGLVVGAAEQTAGRGRRGRVWSSPPGSGLYLSFVLWPPVDPHSSRLLSVLPLAAGVAVRSAVAEATRVEAELKWPNDVVIGRRKLAGVLAEGYAIGTPEQRVVLGVGVNILTAAYPDEVAARATSLEKEVGRPVGLAPTLEELLVAVPRIYQRLRRGDADDILREWRERAPSAEGARVEWLCGERWTSGTTTGIDPHGALLIRTASGIERIISGEVRWL